MITITNETLCLESENLKDILWYIKGAIRQSKLEINDCDFTDEHIKALEVAISVMHKQALKSIKEE